MKKIAFYSVLIVILWTLSACTPGVPPESKSADQKLAKAAMLIESQQDPVVAEQLIRDAISSYQKSRNNQGLAEAYATYGLFFRSDVVGNWQEHFTLKGFADSGSTYANRFQKSLEYYTKAVTIQKNFNNFENLTVLYQETGAVYKLLNLPVKACIEYRKSAASYQQLTSKNPKATLSPPAGFVTYADYLASLSQQLGCK